MSKYILSLDVGTQSIKALVFDLKGRIIQSKKVAIQAYTSPKPGWAEQDARYFWRKLCEACKAVMSTDPKLFSQLKGAAITTQRCTLINVDKNGNPLRQAIVWPDQRRIKDFKPVRGIMSLAFKLIGMQETVRFAQGESEINWLNAHQPDIMEKTHKFLFLSGYLIYRLTGDFIDSYAAQVGYIPFDYKNCTWCKKGDWKWQAFPIDKDKLPDLAPPAAELGRISQKAAGQTGLPAGLRLIAAGSDKTCEFLGSGCISPESGGISFGTTATVGTYIKRYVEVIPFIPPYPSAIPGIYNTEFQIYRGFWLVSWFKKEFAKLEVNTALKQGVAPETLFDRFLDEAPPGSLGLVLQPTWSPGVKIPGPEAKGAIIGFGDAHTRAHLYRAIIEGLCYGLKSGSLMIEKRSNVKLKEIRASGGGAQSSRTLQITADIFNLPVLKSHTHETSALGAAIDAAVGLGCFSTFEQAIKDMTYTEKTYEPDADHVDIYNELYHKVYKHIYARLKPYYQMIREITSYPD
ncbi:MAG: FGGY-family carbohydrate kinase [Spirochaetales bacterium]|nr:FGGY-family carbohydrate kinase [Spirochaetales bacterium]